MTVETKLGELPQNKNAIPDMIKETVETKTGEPLLPENKSVVPDIIKEKEANAVLDKQYSFCCSKKDCSFLTLKFDLPLVESNRCPCTWDYFGFNETDALSVLNCLDAIEPTCFNVLMKQNFSGILKRNHTQYVSAFVRDIAIPRIEKAMHKKDHDYFVQEMAKYEYNKCAYWLWGFVVTIFLMVATFLVVLFIKHNIRDLEKELVYSNSKLLYQVNQNTILNEELQKVKEKLATYESRDDTKGEETTLCMVEFVDGRFVCREVRFRHPTLENVETKIQTMQSHERTHSDLPPIVRLFDFTIEKFLLIRPYVKHNHIWISMLLFAAFFVCILVVDSIMRMIYSLLVEMIEDCFPKNKKSKGKKKDYVFQK